MFKNWGVTEDFLRKKKVRKKEYAKNQYQNMFKEGKEKIKEYWKQCRKNFQSSRNLLISNVLKLMW